MRRDEVLENGQALAEVRLDRTVDDFALRVGHEATHTGELSNLLDVTAGTGEGHHVDRVEAVEVVSHGIADVLVGDGPDLDDLAMALVGAHEAHLVVFLDGGNLLVGLGEDVGLIRRNRRVVDRYRNAGARGVMEAEGLEAIEDLHHLGRLVRVGTILDEASDLLLVHAVVDEGIVLGKHAVEDDAADGGLDALASLLVLVDAIGGLDLGVVLEAHEDLGLQVDVRASVIGVLRVLEVHEAAALALEAVTSGGEVVDADDHVLRRDGERLAMSRRLDVVGAEHEHAGLGLRLTGQRHMHGHLVTVEVGIERRTDERMQADGLALDEHGLEGLDAEAVQGRCAVEQHGMVGDDLLEHVPDQRRATIDHALGRLDIGRLLELDQALHDEGLEQLEGHLLGKAALVDLKLRTDDDDRAAGVVYALAQKVLAEAALLALEHVGKRLERTIARAHDGTTASTVVEEGVHGLLEHALLVVHDDVGSREVEQLLEAVVAVDDATVQVVEVARGKAAAVELHHGA